MYLGIATDTGKQYALKLLEKQKLGSTASIGRQAEREIAAMSKLDHPNILKMVEVNWDQDFFVNGEVKKVIMTVLELASGGELFDFLSYTGCFEEPIARSYFCQLMSGLECCHKAGFAHRDLKPENVLLSEDFVLKIADFGFATLFDGINLLKTECGTRSYMCPEILKGQKYSGTAADIFSSGVILFIILAGFPPFQSAVPTDWWFHKLLTNQQNLFWDAHCRTAYFSPQAKDLLMKMLAPNPDQRITLEEIKKHPWSNGIVLNPAVLSTEMKRRKEHIDSEKKKSKLISAAKNAGGNAFVDRFLGSDLAGSPPAFVPQKNVYHPYNTFRTLVKPLEILVSLECVIRDFDDAAMVAINESSFSLNAKLSGDLSVEVRIFTEVDALLVEVTKDEGDKITFRKLFELMEYTLTERETPRQSGLTKKERSAFAFEQAAAEDLSVYS